MIKELGVTTLMIGLTIFALPTAAETEGACGTSVGEVKRIVKRDFRSADANSLNNFLGRWLATDEVIELKMNTPLVIKGYPVKICPQNNGTFVVRWVSGGGVAGYLKMVNRNMIRISRTAIGTILLERDGTTTARR